MLNCYNFQTFIHINFLFIESIFYTKIITMIVCFHDKLKIEKSCVLRTGVVNLTTRSFQKRWFHAKSDESHDKSTTIWSKNVNEKNNGSIKSDKLYSFDILIYVSKYVSVCLSVIWNDFFCFVWKVSFLAMFDYEFWDAYPKKLKNFLFSSKPIQSIWEMI